MKQMNMIRRMTMVAIATMCVGAAGAAVVIARPQTPQATLPDGSLAALTAEVRALRLTIEDAAKTQVQVQGIGTYLVAQKDRMLHVAARLDAARRETLGVVEQGKESAQQIARAEAALALPVLPQEQRDEYTGALRRWKADLDRLKQTESEARTREALAEQDLQTEQMRWNEIVARLEQLIRK